STPPPASVPKDKYETKDERIEICNGRQHNQVEISGVKYPDAYHALARQLMRIPKLGRTDWTGKSDAQIVNELKNEIRQHMLNKLDSNLPLAERKRWVDVNINDIAESLKKAKSSDAANFTEALRLHNERRRNLSSPERPILEITKA